jgi:choline dehydrogenase-like flavoprotein
MSLRDARLDRPTAPIEADVCVIGAGAAGITVATELARGSGDVVLIESGGLDLEADTQALHDLDNIGYPVRENFMSRVRQFGGSCNLWAGRSMRLVEDDTGPVGDPHGAGWPVSHGELSSYYPRAASILGLPPLEMFESGSYQRGMSGHERRLFEGGPLNPTISLWARSPKRFGPSYRRELSRSSRIRVILHANAVRLRRGEGGGSIEALELATLAAGRFEVRARRYVLACGGLENARLLLVSGIGAEHDVVGRYFMDHPRSVFGRVRLAPGARLPLLRGKPLPGGKVQIGMGLSPEGRRREGLLNHYATLESEFSGYTAAGYQSFVKTMKVVLRKGYAGSRWGVGRSKLGDIPGMIYLLTPKELMPHPIYRLYWAARNALHPRPDGTSRVVVYFCEQPPDRESRVTLGPERDALGVPRIALNWRIGPEVTRSVLALQEILRLRLREAGIGELEAPDDEPRYTDASHHMGTTRMSADPGTGVVDRDCRVHGQANLYVAGSSVFPSAGHANPTLTIVALGIRLAEHLGRR